MSRCEAFGEYDEDLNTENLCSYCADYEVTGESPEMGDSIYNFEPCSNCGSSYDQAELDALMVYLNHVRRLVFNELVEILGWFR